MPEIRPLQPDDLPSVAPLVRTISPDWLPEEDVRDFLARTLIDDPWRDEELPALVATGKDGEVLGFIGSQVRRFRFGDRELRGVCPSHLVVVQDGRAGAAGALLLRRLLSAGQDFSFSDTANDEVLRIWGAFGGHLDAARACDWMIVLRPGRWLGRVAGNAVRRRSVGREQIPVGALPLHAARVGRRRWPDLDPKVAGEDIDRDAVVENLPETTRGLRLYGDYDRAFLDHVLGGVEAMLGTPTVRLVRKEGRPIGWYALVAADAGPVRALHLSAAANEAEAVVGEMLEHAKSRSATLVSGRLEPHLVVPLRRRLAILGFARQPVIHSRDPELLATLETAGSLLTRLDSEWFAT